MSEKKTNLQMEIEIVDFILNDLLHTRVVVLREKGKFEIESSYVPTRVLKSIGVTFRKLSGATEAEVVEKFAAWFVKNAEYIKLLGDY